MATFAAIDDDMAEVWLARHISEAQGERVLESLLETLRASHQAALGSLLLPWRPRPEPQPAACLLGLPCPLGLHSATGVQARGLGTLSCEASPLWSRWRREAPGAEMLL